jgi:hypothetical protein
MPTKFQTRESLKATPATAIMKCIASTVSLERIGSLQPGAARPIATVQPTNPVKLTIDGCILFHIGTILLPTPMVLAASNWTQTSISVILAKYLEKWQSTEKGTEVR